MADQDGNLILCREFAIGWMEALGFEDVREDIDAAIAYAYGIVTTHGPLDARAGHDFGHTSGEAYRLRQAAVDRYGQHIVDRYPSPDDSA